MGERAEDTSQYHECHPHTSVIEKHTLGLQAAPQLDLQLLRLVDP